MESQAVESQAEYSDRLRALEQEFAEVTRQQAATVEVLQVIGESALDLDRVFDTVLRNAVTLCRADAGQLWRLDGNAYRFVGNLGGSDEYNELLSRLRLPLGKESLVRQGRPRVAHGPASGCARRPRLLAS